MYELALVLYVCGLAAFFLGTFITVPRVNLASLGLFLVFLALFVSGAELIGDVRSAMDAVEEATDPATWTAE